MKSILLIILASLLVGCAGTFKDLGAQDNKNYNLYLASYMSCLDSSKNIYEGTDSGGAPVRNVTQGGNCDQIKKPDSVTGEYADYLKTYVGVGGTLLGVIAQGEYSKSAARTQARASVETARINADVQISRDETLREIVRENSDLTRGILEAQEAAAEQSAIQQSIATPEVTPNGG